MSLLREPSLGPIVGHTSQTSSHLWIRGVDPGDKKSNLSSERRTVGVIAIMKENGNPVPNPQAYYFRLHRKYDRTGTFTLGQDRNNRNNQVSSSILSGDVPPDLSPDTLYEVKIGVLSIVDPFDNDENVSDGQLQNILPPENELIDDLSRLPDKTSLATFRTYGQNQGENVSFLVGSCRYPGIFWKVKDSDKIFDPLLTEAGKNYDNGNFPHFVLMVGDQIYADMMNRHIPIGLADTYEEFQDRYEKAFGSRNMRKLLRSFPNYMILDDHEIEDNWSQDRLFKNSHGRKVFNLAIGAYQSYQWSHSPRNFGNRLYYNFSGNGFPFFVLDTRTQRYMDDLEGDLSDNHLLGRPSLDSDEPNQLEILLNWLIQLQRDQGNIPKFIVSSSVFAPNPMFAREGRTRDLNDEKKARLKQKTDSWPAFPETRKALLNCIVSNQIQNVIFISGDVHCSNLAKIILSGPNGDLGLKVYSVTSSAFYWPFCFADGDPSDFVHDSQDEKQEDTFPVGDGLIMDYKAWNFTQEDNYCRIDVNRAQHQMEVRNFDSKGNLIESRGGAPLQEILELAPW